MTHDNDGISRLYYREPSWVSKAARKGHNAHDGNCKYWGGDFAGVDLNAICTRCLAGAADIPSPARALFDTFRSKTRALDLFGGRRSVLRKTIAEQRVLLEKAEAARIEANVEWVRQMTRVAAVWNNYSRDLEADRDSLAEVSRVLAESLVVRWKPKTVETAARRVLEGDSPDRGRAVGVMIEAFERSERARALTELL